MKKITSFIALSLSFLGIFLIFTTIFFSYRFIYKTIKTEYQWKPIDTEKLISEIRNQNSAYCETLSDSNRISITSYIDAKTACYSLISKISNNPDLCNKIDDTHLAPMDNRIFNTERTKCFLQFVWKNNDIKYCDYPNDQINKDICYDEYATKINNSGDSSICEKIKIDPYSYSHCYALTSQGKLCKDLKLRNVNLDKNCYNLIFRGDLLELSKNIDKDIDSSVCDIIDPKKEDYRSDCRYFFAAISNEQNDCVYIKSRYSHQDSEYCYTLKAVYNSDDKFCDFIENQKRKDDCKFKVKVAKLEIKSDGLSNQSIKIMEDDNNLDIDLEPFIHSSDL